MRLRVKRPSPGTVMGALALFISLGGTTYAATGGNFLLGKSNSATSQTALSAPIANKALQVTNTSTASGAAGIGVTVAAKHAPLVVPANAGKATNLNADKLDGVDSSGFYAAGSKVADSDLLDGKDSTALEGARAWAMVMPGNCSGSPAFCSSPARHNVAYIVKVGVGRYCVGVSGVNAANHVALVNPRLPNAAENVDYWRFEAFWIPSFLSSYDHACVSNEFEFATYLASAAGARSPRDVDFTFVIP